MRATLSALTAYILRVYYVIYGEQKKTIIAYEYRFMILVIFYVENRIMDILRMMVVAVFQTKT